MKQLLDCLITLQEAQPERLAAALADALKDFRQPVSSSPVGSDFPISQAKISQPVAAPSKMELAIEYLKNHPEDMQLTGRELEATRFPMGVKISYRTWNESKKPRAK